MSMRTPCALMHVGVGCDNDIRPACISSIRSYPGSARVNKALHSCTSRWASKCRRVYPVSGIHSHTT
eukprot:22621-Eustigmatos_ZCMA.PRE.1